MKVAFTFTNLTPILFHADDIEASDEVTAWIMDPANKDRGVPGDDRTPPWKWQTYLYFDEKHIAWPSANITAGLRQAGSQIKLRGSKTFKELTQTGMYIPTPFCQFKGPNGQVSRSQLDKLRELSFSDQAKKVQALGFTLFPKRAPVGKGKNRPKHVRVRAQFTKWEISGEIIVTAPEIGFTELTTLMEILGRLGQGDWRPGCTTPGPFGQFTANLKIIS